ncbi:ParA family protein [Streptomyces sp. NRRL B-24484]|uniref:ParA family protein n=1 Tax=Streptomyces sp. NRRL B-24484 TaxID=1463833 RepID=UPI000AAF6768|nr:ParA family protein [Streptomyces sp. NRRL B-24484]
MTMETVAVLNQKGGVGKTTDTINLGGALAEYGRRTLLVDLDPQGNLTSALGVDRLSGELTLTTAMLNGCTAEDARALVHQHSDGLYVIPSSLDMFSLPRKLHSERAAHERLRRVLRHLDDAFDVCLIDCRPGLDVDTDAALYAAGSIVIPVDVDEFSIEALSLLLGQMQTLADELEHPAPTVRGLIINRVILPLSAINSAVMEQLKGAGVPALAEVPIRSILAEARNQRLTITQYAPKSDVARLFRDLAKASGLVA